MLTIDPAQQTNVQMVLYIGNHMLKKSAPACSAANLASWPTAEPGQLVTLREL